MGWCRCPVRRESPSVDRLRLRQWRGIGRSKVDSNCAAGVVAPLESSISRETSHSSRHAQPEMWRPCVTALVVCSILDHQTTPLPTDPGGDFAYRAGAHCSCERWGCVAGLHREQLIGGRAHWRSESNSLLDVSISRKRVDGGALAMALTLSTMRTPSKSTSVLPDWGDRHSHGRPGPAHRAHPSGDVALGHLAGPTSRSPTLSGKVHLGA